MTDHDYDDFTIVGSYIDQKTYHRFVIGHYENKWRIFHLTENETYFKDYEDRIVALCYFQQIISKSIMN